MSVRKAHNTGKNHLRNVVDYYQRTLNPSVGYKVPREKEEIGHEKAQSVIDSITSSYAAEGQAGANPMLGQHPGPGQPFPPPPFGFPGGMMPPFGMPGGGPGGFPRKSRLFHDPTPKPRKHQTFPDVSFLAPMPGNGMPFPPFPPNVAGGMPPLPGGMPFPAGMPPPDFRFPPPQFGPPQGMGPSPGGQGGFGPPPFGGGGDRR
ncbi:hypothetical protein MMC27_007044 [Xylographa pallens]|nr:hypothetical protein [Xylographa pallens]